MNEIKKINKPNFKYYFPSKVGSSFVVLESHGDGSCFVHSVCRAITKDYELLSNDEQIFIGRQYRKKFNDIINEQEYHLIIEKLMKSKNASLYKQNMYNYNTFKQKVGNYKTWSDLIIISVFAIKLKMNLIFYDSKLDKLYTGVNNFDQLEKNKSIPTIIIEWQNHNHFNLIAKCIKKSNKIILQKQFFLKDDSELINRLKKKF